MQKYVGVLAKCPARTALAWYLGVIAAGTLLLWLPVSRRDARESISLVDAAFTATSATCVTGLTVRSTANDFSYFGQTVVITVLSFPVMEYSAHRSCCASFRDRTVPRRLQVVQCEQRIRFSLFLAGFFLTTGEIPVRVC